MILDPALTAAYLIIALAVALSPGPDVLFVLANSLQHKLKGALASALGIGAGSLLHALAAAVGISALIAASPLAFDALRYAGAAYLAWLGFQALRSWYRGTGIDPASPRETETTALRVFQRALLTNILNPKVIVFYLALLPQFVNPELGQVGLQIFLLGSMHAGIGVVYLASIGFAAGRASDWLATTSFGRWMDGIAGVFFIGLAIRLALSGRPER